MKQLTRSMMTEDVEELVQLLVESHPDPFRHFGGPVSFYDAATRLLDSLPETSSPTQFWRLLSPFVARLRDGHTRILCEQPPDAGRWPAEFGIVGEQLYVQSVRQRDLLPLLGAQLMGIDGVSWSELCDRQQQLQGSDNVIDNLRRLTQNMASRSLLAALLDYDQKMNTMRFALKRPHHQQSEIYEWSWDAYDHDVIVPASTVHCPPLDTGSITWGFLDENHDIACLRVGELMNYREAFEEWNHMGFQRPIEAAWSKHFPDEPFQVQALPKLLSRIPSACETLENLWQAALTNHTTWLIVDLRGAIGGNSLFETILLYGLYGLDAVLENDGGYQIPRYSPLYLKNYRVLPDGASLKLGGYDFRDQREWQKRRRTPLCSASRKQAEAEKQWEQWIESIPTLAKWVHRQTTKKTRWSPKVLMVTGANTYSAGFDVAAMLWSHGAKHFGTAPAQAGNCFIDVLHFALPHSCCYGTISYKESWRFPENPEIGTILTPQFPLTYEMLSRYDFDPNASIRMALEYIQRRRESV
ncbi:hypothetical protein [Sulfobacillus thermosulfidooxidans]|uniref:hypothetical protein n=1 Tax=Sulfobacillus thermosulfidooxidans TaxID=28034 RepID=UPI0006B53CA3|nr:hypothetical protein [Sulfobacillus thermosulfidooxidans]